jgi:hypothetical protein
VGDPRGGFKYPLSSVTLYGRTLVSAAGATAAGPIWENIMKSIHTGVPKVGFTPVNANQANGIGNIIPDVRGLTRAQAIQTLQDAGLDVAIAKALAPRDKVTPAGLVAGQTPDGGTLSLPTGLVTLTLTAGSDPTVPVLPRPTPRPTVKPSTPATPSLGATEKKKNTDPSQPRPVPSLSPAKAR